MANREIKDPERPMSTPQRPSPWAVIMAGGSGTRFWPVSRNDRPKQLLRLLGDDTLIQATIARLQPLVPAERVLVITTAAIADATRRQLPMLAAEQVIAEPVGRDTAACVALAAEIVARRDPGGTMILLPADQVIAPADRFQACLAAGCAVAASGALVTYGIAPRHPATGYGYIRLGATLPSVDGCAVNQVERFVEKPARAVAEQYVQEGCYRWNSGIFTWRVDVVRRELAEHCPALMKALAPVGAAYATPGFAAALAAAYGPLPRISIDYALMERAKAIAVVTADFAWDDVGSWDALVEHLPADALGVSQRGETLALDCQDSLLYAEEGAPLLAGVGLRDLLLVATRDAVLAVPRGQSQDVKKVVEALKARRAELL